MNNVNLSGRITKDIELKTTKADTPMVQFTLACKRKLSNQDGEKLTDFFNCVAFGPRAVFLAKYACKSTVIGIEGRLQSKSYVDEHEKRHQTIDVICESVEIFRVPADHNTNNDHNHNEETNKHDDHETIVSEESTEINTINIDDSINTNEVNKEDDENLDDFNRMMNNFSSFFD